MKRLLSSFFIFLLAIPTLPARTYIVSVGIADYPGRQNDLRVSANDAKTISGIFTKNGNATVDCFVNSDVTIKKVCTAMRNTFAKASPSDAVILYFSGHGVPGGLVCYDGFLYYSSVLSIMRQSKAQQKMIFVDACFAGKMRNTNKRNTNYSKENVMFFLSSRSTEKSLETPRQTGFKNSLFTVFLERGLRGGADTNKDRVITAKEIYNFVHQGVVEASGNRQHPVMWGKFDGNMPVINGEYPLIDSKRNPSGNLGTMVLSSIRFIILYFQTPISYIYPLVFYAVSDKFTIFVPLKTTKK